MAGGDDRLCIGEAVLLEHLLGGIEIHPQVAGQLLGGADLSRHLDGVLVLLRKLVPRVLVDHNAVDTAGLIPCRRAPVLGNLL